MKFHLSKIVLHPFFLLLFPIISLYAFNIRFIHIQELFRPVLVGLLLSGGLLLFFFFLSRNMHRSAIAVSIIEILFFSFGHFYILINHLAPGQIIGQANILAAVWAAVLILTVWYSLRLLNNARELTYLLNITTKDTCVWERFSILNAYYLPGVKETDLYPEISPVNTFRVVFNTYFDENLPMEKDRSFFSTWNRPYQFFEVTNRLKETCKAP